MDKRIYNTLNKYNITFTENEVKKLYPLISRFSIRIKNITEFYTRYKIEVQLSLNDIYKICNNLDSYTKVNGNKQTKERFKIILQDFYKDKYYEEYCKNKTSNWKPKNSNTRSYNAYLEKYQDKTIAAEKYNQSRYNSGKSLRIEYWLNKGYNKIQALEELSNRQRTFSKEKCIEKYGYKIGTQKWKQRQIKWQNTMNNKSDEEKRRINKLKVNGSLKNFKKFNISKAEIELCNLLNGESQFLIENDNNSFYLYDIKIGENKLIEYNGDYWHCNPNKWKANNFNKSIQMYAKDKWYKDRIKIENAKNKGYDILVIWEEEWKADKNKVIQKCKEFINDN